LRAESNAYTEFVCAFELGPERGLSDAFAKGLHVGDRQIAIHGVDQPLNGYGERFDVVGGANEKGGRNEVIAKDGRVEGRMVRLTDGPARVAYGADSLEDLAEIVDAQVLAKGIFIGETAISGLLADEDDIGVVEALSGSETATSTDRYSGCREVVRVGGANQEIETRGIGTGRTLKDGDKETPPQPRPEAVLTSPAVSMPARTPRRNSSMNAAFCTGLL
jgi:hypothetical protein